MGINKEQISWPEHSQRYKKHVKREIKRKRRRDEKSDPQGAPRRNEYAGWTT